MKILFLCKKRPSSYSGGFYGLSTSAKLVTNAIESDTIKCSIDFPVDGNDVDRCIYSAKPNLVIIEALFITPDKMAELAKLYPKIKFIIRVHSVYVFLSGEGCAFDWIYEYRKIPNVEVSFNHLEFSKDMEKLNCPNQYLPNIYFQDYKIERKYNKYSNDIINIGNFGHLRVLKNNIHQAIAAIRFADSIGKKLRFHINAHTDDGTVNNVLKNLKALFENSKHELIEHDWMNHTNFCKLVSTMDMGMCISLSESFCITAADMVYLNIPIVTSKEVKFISKLFQTGNDTNQILRTMYLAYYGDRFNLQSLNRKLLDKHNNEALEIWKNYVSKSQPLLSST